MARQKFGLGATFQTASQSQASVIGELEERNSSLEEEITRLKATSTTASEKANLEAKLQQLAQRLESQSGSVEVPLQEIARNPFQPRTIFPQQEIEAFAKILSEEGQNTPIILMPLSQKVKDAIWELVKPLLFQELENEAEKSAAWAKIKYFIFDGERRWRSQAFLNSRIIRSVFRPEEFDIDFMRVQRDALSTTLHRKDLHELNLANCLIQQIIYSYPDIADNGSAADTIPKLLEGAINRLNYLGKSSELRQIVEASAEEQEAWLASIDLKTIEEQNVLAVLLKFRLHPGSIDSNVFPTLKLPEDLKELIQATGLEISKVSELKKLTADRLQLAESEAVEIRHRLGKVIVQEKLKLSEVKALVEKELLKHGIQTKKKKTVADQVRGLKIDKLKPEELVEVRAALEQKLSELQQSMQTA